MLIKLKLCAALVVGIASFLTNASPAPLVARSINSAELLKRTDTPTSITPSCAIMYVGQNETPSKVCLSIVGETLVVTYNPVPGFTYSAVHVYISTTGPPPTPPAPGSFPYTTGNGYCTLLNGGSSATCSIPFSALGGVATLCSAKYYIATHADLGTETGWGFGSCINDPAALNPPKGCPKNWAMFSTFTVTCTPTIPPQPPKTCSLGTAFGYNANKFLLLNTISGAPKGRWGWYYKLAPSDLASAFTGSLLVGAGGNDVGSATNVGGFSITLSGGDATVKYTLSSGYDLGEVHVYASCSPPTTVAPGQYGYTEAFPGTSDPSFSHTFTLGTCSYYYFILHATINKSVPEGTVCPPESS